MANLKIERINYKKDVKHVNDVDTKITLEKINEHYYLTKGYKRNMLSDAWTPYASTSYFDGIETVDTGKVMRVSGSVDEYFELLVKYEKYMYVNDEETSE